MANMLAARARRYLSSAGHAFDRAPIEVSSLILLAAVFSCSVQMDAGGQVWAETAIVALLIVAAAWTGTLLHALGAWSPSRRRLITIAGTALAGLYAWRVLDLDRETEGWRAFMLLAAAALWLLAVPALAAARGQSLDGATDRFRAVAARQLLRAFGAAVYSLALFAGLALALAAVDTLFELSLDGRLYAHVAGWIFMVLGPWIVIGGLPEYVQPVEPRREVAGVAHRMLAFLVPPLLALYFLILYAYAIRIGVTGEVPRNLVSPMVIAAGVLAVVALILFDPRSGDGGWSRALRAVPPLFLPLAALGIYTVWLRVEQYGWTEFRLLRTVALVALALLAVGATVQLLRRRRFTLHAPPLVAAAVLLLAAVGPWSVPALARASQQARLEAALLDVGIDPSAPRLSPSGETRTIDHARYEDIATTARYLARSHGVHSLPPVLAVHAHDRDAIGDLPARAGLRPEALDPDRGPHRGPDRAPARTMVGRLAQGTPIPWRDATVLRVGFRIGESDRATGGVTLAPATATLRIRIGAEWLTADLAAVQSALHAGPTGGPGTAELHADAARIAVYDAEGAHRGVLLILDIALDTTRGELRLRQLDALLLLEPGEAPGPDPSTRQ
jgi:hypothetical protein